MLRVGIAAPFRVRGDFRVYRLEPNRNHYCVRVIENQGFAIVASIKLTTHSISFCLGIKRTAQFLGNCGFVNLDAFSRLFCRIV